MPRILGVVAAICAIIAGTGAIAQDVTLAPSFGTASLRSGQLPDPTIVEIAAGGPQAFNIRGCAGYVAQAPDYRVTFTAGSSRPLSFSVESPGDTVLLVNAPDGTWHCNDDFFNLDPAISFAAPLSGQYDIWIGTFENGRTYQSWLVVAEFWLQ